RHAPPILVRKYRRALQRPGDAEVGIVPGDGPLELRREVIRGFVEEVCGLRQNQEAMGKSLRHPGHVPVLRRQLETDPLAECRRTPAYIHHHIENSALD